MPVKDRERNRARIREHYEKNRAYYAEKRKRQRVRLFRFVAAYCARRACARCGAPGIRVLSHRHEVSHGLQFGWGTERLMQILQVSTVICEKCATSPLPAARRSDT